MSRRVGLSTWECFGKPSWCLLWLNSSPLLFLLLLTADYPGFMGSAQAWNVQSLLWSWFWAQQKLDPKENYVRTHSGKCTCSVWEGGLFHWARYCQGVSGSTGTSSERKTLAVGNDRPARSLSFWGWCLMAGHQPGCTKAYSAKGWTWNTVPGNGWLRRVTEFGR